MAPLPVTPLPVSAFACAASRSCRLVATTARTISAAIIGNVSTKPIGSSPRWAGNTPGAGNPARQAPVHPRAGGEHYSAQVAAGNVYGSSPRGRGTRARDAVRMTTHQVHPRAGGKHSGTLGGVHSEVGSSPRGRGTRGSPTDDPVRHRFIPARAGNTSWRCSWGGGTTVHPRAGGEHPSTGCATSSRIGSSPRGRGTRDHYRRRRDHLRFIPARAGNTWRGASSAPPTAVHPRAGGEHPVSGSTRAAAFGSSPRGRGTRQQHLSPPPAERFIPARAGNTRCRRRRGRRGAVHPRAGGEHTELHTVERLVGGSSPRGRGTRLVRQTRQCAPRFIPARAGNTDTDAKILRKHEVHPRAGGEHLHNPRDERREARFIPARAGNTRRTGVRREDRAVHPRAGGEHRWPPKESGVGVGSSPRGRGTLDPLP